MEQRFGPRAAWCAVFYKNDRARPLIRQTTPKFGRRGVPVSCLISSSALLQLFFSSIPPLVVATRSSRPPPPTVPDRSFELKLPCTVIGKSVCTPPLVVEARTENSAPEGSVTFTLPFVVISSSSPSHLALPIATRTPPFVVRAEAHSLVETSTFPFVVAASTTLFKSRQCTPPFVVIAFNRTPLGTCTSKLIRACRPCQPQLLLESDETPP